MTAPVPSGGFSLFPSTGRPPSRTHVSRPSQQQNQQTGRPAPEPTTQFAASPQHPVGEAVTAEVRLPAPVPDAQLRRGDNVQDPGRSNSVQSRSSIAKVRLSTYDDNPQDMDDPPPPMPGQAADVIEQQQLHHLQQHQQHLQQVQPQPGRPAQGHRPPALRSIFPQYNPEVSLDQQDYFPTQTSPARIPRAVISRPLYSPVSPNSQQSPPQHAQSLDQHAQPPSIFDPIHTQASPATAAAAARPQQQQQHQQQSVPVLSLDVGNSGPVSSTTTATPASRWPTLSGAAAAAARSGQREAPTLPVPSSSDELRNFWKVANGWKAGPSEGRVYCMRMSCDNDAPVYRLSSASHQPFYRLRLDPTSMSAYVTLSRHDPARPFKIESSKNAGNTDNESGGDGAGSGSDSVVDSGAPNGSMIGGGGTAATTPANPYARFDGSKNWQVAMTTTLEEEARRHQPEDGLVALLYPAAATRMALERPNDMAMVMTAERECGRLVWDDDSGQFFLVHPALALPFSVTIERSTTWSRTAYTLEHLESPQHLARLTRDGTGAGYLEVDTGIASKIDAVYLVDVVVAALLLVAHSDGQFTQVEQFAPPPDLRQAPNAHLAGHGGGVNGSPRGSLVNMVMGGIAGGGRSASRLSFGSRHDSGQNGGKKGSGGGGFFGRKPKPAKKGRARMDELDLDLESQTSIDLSSKMFEMGPMSNTGTGISAAGSKRQRRKSKKDEDKMPGCLRLITMIFKCCFWCVAICVRAMLAIVGGIFKCVFGEKL